MTFRILKVFRYMHEGMAFCLLCITLASCSQSEDRPSLTVIELERQSPFSAKMDRVYEGQVADSNFVMKEMVIVGLETTGGKKIAICESGTNADLLLSFAHTLTNGTSYKFPSVWLDYKKSKVNGSAITNDAKQ